MSEKLRMLAKSSWWKKGKESLHFGKIVANIMLFIQIRNSTGTFLLVLSEKFEVLEMVKTLPKSKKIVSNRESGKF